MLTFIFGRAATGKTYEILNRIKKSVENGLKPILIVPEQFSFESEKAVLDLLGDKGAQSVSVMSFTRLCDEVERTSGGMCGKVLGEAQKAIFMGTAIRRVANDLKIWGSYRRSAGFARSILDAVSEFKINAISAEDIFSVCERTQGNLSLKLYDTATIYREYNTLVSERFIDPADRLEKLYFALENSQYFANRPVFFDSFKGFTGQQFKIIDRIMSATSDIIVSLTNDTNDSRKYGLLRNIKRTEQRLRKMAQSHALEVTEIQLCENHYENKDLLNVEQTMFGLSVEGDKKLNGVTVCKAETIYDEAEFVARNIRRIVRQQKARFDDFVIIARDTEPYEQALSAACERNGVYCFIDRRIPLSSLPVAVAAITATEATTFSTDKILRFLKSGISLLSSDEISVLENYTYLWNINGDMWLKSWDMNPAGFKAEQSDKETQELVKINELREMVVTPLVKFKNEFGGSAREMSGAIVNLFRRVKAADAFLALTEQYSQRGRQNYADALRQSWDVMMSLLDSLVNCFGEASLSKTEFCEALKNSVSLTDIGIAPQMIDEVTFGAADRIRPSRPKYAFIIGANQGIFPRNSVSSGIFGSAERASLISLGLDISDKTLDNAIDEEFLVYSNVCCPSREVFVSYTSLLANGSTGQPSSFVNRLESIGCAIICEPAPLSADNLPETAESAFSEGCRRLCANSDEYQTIVSALDAEDIKSRLSSVKSGRQGIDASLTPATAKRLFGSTVWMSPTKFDNFNRCKFRYFCRDGLKANRLLPAEFNALQRGTLVHYVLQRVIEIHGKDVSELSKAQISAEVKRLTDEYLDSIVGYRSVENARLKFIVTTITRMLEYVVSRLALEFAQSQFEPVKCELKIGADGDMPEITVPIEDMGTLKLNGVVDRLDRWNGYVRIVDYKTGHRDFKLPDILFGQNMQMLLYLYAVSKNEQFGGKPAGILYMGAMRVKDGKPADRRMNGIISAESDVAAAMDAENKGEFIPKFKADAPSDSFITDQDFKKIFDFIDRKLVLTGKSIFEGRIAPDPVDGLDSAACDYCDFAAVCRMGNKKHKKVPKLSNEAVIKQLAKEDVTDGI